MVENRELSIISVEYMFKIDILVIDVSLVCVEKETRLWKDVKNYNSMQLYFNLFRNKKILKRDSCENITIYVIYKILQTRFFLN